jgi:alpha-tubulin suppressor-like RCC1 family protein
MEPLPFRQEDGISCGKFHSAVVTQVGKVVCWGKREDGRCDVPQDLENVIAVSCGTNHSAAVTQEGRVVCWGNNNLGLRS